jgi:hypothetical protein
MWIFWVAPGAVTAHRRRLDEVVSRLDSIERKFDELGQRMLTA